MTVLKGVNEFSRADNGDEGLTNDDESLPKCEINKKCKIKMKKKTRQRQRSCKSRKVKTRERDKSMIEKVC